MELRPSAAVVVSKNHSLFTPKEDCGMHSNKMGIHENTQIQTERGTHTYSINALLLQRTGVQRELLVRSYGNFYTPFDCDF